MKSRLWCYLWVFLAFLTIPFSVNATPPAQERTIAYGEAITATFESIATDSWTFTGEADDIVAIYVQSNLNTSLDLYSPDGELIATNDDLFREDPYLSDIVLPTDGTYLIVVTESNGTLGAYTLTLLQKEAILDPDQRELHYGDSAQVELPTHGDDQWTFQGEAGDRVTIGMNASFQVAIELLSPSGSVLAGDHQHYYVDAYLPKMVLPASGNYRITVTSLEENPEKRDYAIGLLADLEGTRSIQYGEILGGGVKPGLDEIFTFEGTAGDIVTIRDEERMAVYLILYNARGVVLAETGHSFMDHPEIINFRLPTTGEYTIVVGTDIPLVSPSSNTEPLMEFRLSLTLVPNITLTYGTTQEVKAPTEDPFAEGHDIFNFEGHTGDIVVVTVMGDLNTSLSLYDPNERPIAVSDDNYSEPFTLQETLTMDGTYSIHVDTEYFMGDGYTISLTNQSDTSNYAVLKFREPLHGTFAGYNGIEASFTGVEGDVIALYVDIGDSLFEDSGVITLLAPDKTAYTFPLTNVVYGLDCPPIVNFMLPQTGDYALRITAEDWIGATDREIDYTLRLYSNLYQFPLMSHYSSSLREVEKSDETSAFPLLFRGEAGDVITIRLDVPPSNEDDIYFQFYDPANNVLIQANLNDVPDSILTNYELPLDGIYLILPAIFDDTPDTINLSVSLAEAGTGTSATLTPAPPLGYGYSVKGTLISGQRSQWQFTGNVGDVITINVSSDFDSYLELYSADGEVLVINDDTNGIDAEITAFTLPESGSYTIILSGLGNASGTYTLTLSQP
jgi:hypothetical protein